MLNVGSQTQVDARDMRMLTNKSVQRKADSDEVALQIKFQALPDMVQKISSEYYAYVQRLYARGNDAETANTQQLTANIISDKSG